MLRITLTIDNQPQFDRVFTRFTEQLSDLRQLWPGVVSDLRLMMREQFAGRGVGPAGQWRQLSRQYAEWKAQHFPGLPILQRTRRLVTSLTGNTADTVYDPQPLTLSFGTRAPYAIFHQRGTKRMPRRAIFDFNEVQKTRLTKTVQRRLLSAVRPGVSLQ